MPSLVFMNEATEALLALLQGLPGLIVLRDIPDDAHDLARQGADDPGLEVHDPFARETEIGEGLDLPGKLSLPEGDLTRCEAIGETGSPV